ncbi:MAG: hypothetical protein K0S51_1241 [Bacillales bacterium]|jgi:hypothetical protein|nr:hypothetical protein [Bacillales bacterium]
MVIQSNMSPKSIVEVWKHTAATFHEYNIPIIDQPLEFFVDREKISSLMMELNRLVGSSPATCVHGG